MFQSTTARLTYFTVIASSAMAFTTLGLSPRAACESWSILNTTYPSITSTYTVKENETMASIAASLNLSACDIARANRMADATLVYTGEQLSIPGASTCPDDISCLISSNTSPTATCVMGGPHVYTTIDGDTLRSIAEEKFNITLASLQTTTKGPSTNDTDTPIGAGQTIKLPLCKESQCLMSPYQIQYGTYADIALAYGATVGQIMAMNPTYNKSTAAIGDGPVITIPMACKLTTDGTPTIIS